MQSENKISKIPSGINKHYIVEMPTSTEKKILIDFFKQAYSDQFNAPYHQNEEEIVKRWDWYNVKNPNVRNKQSTSWICKVRKTGKIVGHCGIIPALLKHKDTCSSIAWGRDFIVLPEFRKLGIGPFLLDSVLKKIKNEISLFLIAGGNEEVFKIYKKLGFVDLGYIPLYVRMVRIDNILKNKLTNQLVAHSLGFVGKGVLNILHTASFMQSIKYRKQETAIEEIFNFDDSLDELWKSASCSLPLIIKRDIASLKWRFIEQPYWKYRIFKALNENGKKTKGYIVLRKGKSRGFNVGIISDLFAASWDIQTIFSLVNFAVKYFEEKGDIDLVKCNILNKNFEFVLKKLGFMNMASSSRFMITNITEPLNSTLVSNRNNWFINCADSDLDLY
ncbi:MAG: GNAT family N-acetyltransferase [Candidatus Omnitrophica bacterium]|nr:GNAT family N-acetyltransferase [Candidatus Omnitrophota bacterium]